jgi:hypothetical protein
VIEVIDRGTRVQFAFEDLLRYSGPGSPAGVALAFQAMTLTFPLLDPTAPIERRAVSIETAFRGPGARDGFELVTRAVTEDRYRVTADLERPERGKTLAQFVFRIRYPDRALTLLVRAGVVSDDFVAYAGKEDRTPEEEHHFIALKAAHADAVLAADPSEVFEVEPG